MLNKTLIMTFCVSVGLLCTELHAATEWNVSLWGKRRAFTENVENIACRKKDEWRL